PYLSGYDVYSFASDAAELDAVRSGVVDFGYLSPGELRLTATLERAGYRVKPWRVFYSNMAEFGYTGPDRALVAQLYLRQALQHLVDETLYLSATLHGYGLLDYGAAPDYPGSSYVSPALRHDPYPYSIAAARRLLAAHGWVGAAGGVDRCERPGVASNDCGAGISRNRP
ncbi:extracellular solute-binding protein family 5, partial [mine drainage metagenome]